MGLPQPSRQQVTQTVRLVEAFTGVFKESIMETDEGHRAAEECVEYFVAIARCYCQLIEKLPTNREVWLEEVFKRLVQLYGAGFDLPEIEALTGSEEVSYADISHEQWLEIYKQLSGTLGFSAIYWHYSLPTEPPNSDPSASYGDLADDLSDIYRDVKNGLLQWELKSELHQADAIWHWKFLHQQHWGIHASWAIPILHQLVYFRGLQDMSISTADSQEVET